MKKVVAKFGGVSVQTKKSIDSIYYIIKNNKDIKVIIVSAIGNITNLLLKLCNKKTTSIIKKDILNQIKNIHFELLKDLKLLKLKSTIESNIDNIKNLFNNKNINKPTIDEILSRGEDLSSFIIFNYLLKKKINIELLNARDYIITDNNHSNAEPNTKLIKEKYAKLNLNKKIYITQGFIGSTVNSITTTIGRGGSDYSAALISEAINADELLIYTDVEGVYTSDPNIISHAKLIKTLSFQEMSEMANFGAKILHPATLEPCARSKIPITVLSTFNPDNHGTYINIKNNSNEKTNIKAITLRKNQILVTIKSSKMLNAYGYVANIFKILAKYKISIDIITTSEIKVALTVDKNSISSHSINPFVSNNNLIKELNKFATIKIENNLTLISIIGSNLTKPGTIQSILDIIKDYKIRLTCYGASNSNISILINQNDDIKILELLHKKLVLRK